MSKEIEKMTAIYEKHKNTMYAVALKILKNPQDAEDAVHNTIPSIMRNLDAIKDVDSKDCIYYVTMAVKHMCEMLGGISTKTAYRLLKAGTIKSFVVGRRYRIPKLNILEYLELIEKSNA